MLHFSRSFMSMACICLPPVLIDCITGTSNCRKTFPSRARFRDDMLLLPIQHGTGLHWLYQNAIM